MEDSAATADGKRILARAETGHRATLAALASGDPIGRTVRIHSEAGVNYIQEIESPRPALEAMGRSSAA